MTKAYGEDGAVRLEFSINLEMWQVLRAGYDICRVGADMMICFSPSFTYRNWRGYTRLGAALAK